MSDHLAEIERLKNELERAKNEIEGLREMADSQFNAHLKARNELERVQKQAAAMRKFITCQPEYRLSTSFKVGADTAISNAGSDYIPKSDVKPLVEALESAGDALRDLSWYEDARGMVRAALVHAKAKGLL